MSDFFIFILIILIGIFVYYFRRFVISTVAYKEARSAEIKRRLQVEHQNEKALKQRLSQPIDDFEKLKIEVRAANERHQRAIHYVIEDMFERYQ
jgi:hypothetical protein